MSGQRQIQISGCRLIDPTNGLDLVTDVFFDNNLLVATGTAPDGFQPEIIDGTSLLVCPRFVDSTFHLTEPGHEQKGTIESETFAARQSGFGSIVSLPDTSPVTDSPAVANLLRDRAWQYSHANIHPLGALTRSLAGEQLSELAALKEAGCIGFTNYRSAFANTKVAIQALKYAKTFDLLVCFFSHEPSLYENGHANDGPLASRLGLNGIPNIAETIAVAQNLMLVEETGVKAHFGQVSCAGSVELIANAQARGLPVTASASIMHLVFDDSSIADYNADFHVIPPLRSKHDIAALREGLKSGVINSISSDHHPHETAAKMAPFPSSEPGISTIDCFVPLCLGLVEDGVTDLPGLVRLVASNPAENFSLVSAGSIQPDSFAVIDLAQEWTLDEDNMFSMGKNSPLKGQLMKGRYIQL